MKRKNMELLSKRNVIVAAVILAVGITFFLSKGGLTGFVVKDADNTATEKLQITVGNLETATYNDYDFDAKRWLDNEYYRIWVRVFNPGDETKTFDSIKLIDNFGNQYEPYESIANRISKTEKIFGNYLEVSPQTIREGYLAFPKLDTRNVRLVFVVDGKTNAFQLR